jgi:YidC/Oxa1 family membrane protein insertase
VKLDSRGAVVTSWVIKKNKENNRPLYSVAGEKNRHEHLELVSPEGLKRGEAPLRLTVGDKALDDVLTSKNYRVGNVGGEGGDVSLNLAAGESKTVEFTLHDDATGLDVTKSVTFNAERYGAELKTKLTRGGEAVPQATLLVGPSIGDQGIRSYTFYFIAPEGVAFVNNETQRLAGAAVHSDGKGWLSSARPEGADRQILKGNVDWAGVGDTYFAMVAVPSRQTQGLEYRTSAYDYQNDGKKEERYLISALVPIPADGSATQIYVGPKDHALLTSASQEISQTAGGRKVNLEELINYGWLLGSLRRFLAVPILWSINKLQAITGSYGVAIILFTVLIYSLFFPLKWRSSKSMKKAQKHEGAAREDQGDEAERPAPERVADGATASDEGGEPPGRLPAPSDSDAVPLRALHGHHHLARLPPGLVLVDA